MPPNATLRVQLLGRFGLILPDGRRAGPWGRPTARRLVQLISLRPEHRLGREAAADLLFPDLSPAGSANGVAKALSMARAAIGPVGPGGVPALVSDRTSIWIHETVDLRSDLDDLVETLHAALAMSPGTARDAALTRATDAEPTLLPEEPYAGWASEARQELDELRRTALLELARDRSLGHGVADARAVSSAWAAVAARDATSEEAAIGLMRAYAAARERDRALRAYVLCVRALRDELDAGPSAELEQAYAELVARDRGGDVGASADRPLLPRLFGRDRPRAAIRRRLVGTAAGHGAAVLLVGPTGIGKTHLLGSMVEELASAGWVVLSGRSVPDDRRAPYAALRQALAHVVLDGDRRELLVAALGLGGPTPDTAREPSEHDRVRIADELSGLLDDHAAHRPVVLALDDVQWADPALHGLLRRLAARPGARRWSLLLAARSDEPGAPVPALGSAVKVLAVPTLDERATAAAIRAALREDGTRPAASRVAQAVARSRGNPFFAIELARASNGNGQPSAATVPEAIVGLLRQRLEGISPAARTMLAIVALAGGEATFELVLATLSRLGGPSPASPPHLGVDELIGARLVVEEGSRLALVHPLLGDAAGTTVNAIRRSAIHGALADALESLSSDDARLIAAARHRLAAFEATRMTAAARVAAEAGFRAGHRARDIHAPEVALSLFEAALDAYNTIPETARHELSGAACAAWLTVGNIHLDNDDDQGAARAYRQSLSHAMTDSDLARAWSALAGIPYRHGDMAGALAAYRQGLASLSGVDARAHARLESDSAWALSRLGRHAEALEIMQRVAPVLLEAPETHLRCRTKDRLGRAFGATGQPEEGLAWLTDGVTDAMTHGDDRELAILCLHRGGLLGQLGRHDDAEEDLVQAGRIADAAHDRYLRAVIHWNMADLDEARGDLEGALAERAAEIQLLVGIGNDRNLAGAEAHVARLLARLGRRSDARGAAGRAREAAERTGDERLRETVQRALEPVLASGKSLGRAAS